jgi:hypothetical protein
MLQMVSLQKAEFAMNFLLHDSTRQSAAVKFSKGKQRVQEGPSGPADVVVGGGEEIKGEQSCQVNHLAWVAKVVLLRQKNRISSKKEEHHGDTNRKTHSQSREGTRV